MREQEFYSEDFYSQEQVSNSNDDDVLLTNYANYADNTDIAASLELKEAIALLRQSFEWAAESVKNSGLLARRRLYVLYWIALALSPEIRTSRKEAAKRLSLKVSTLDKDIAFCKAELKQGCIVHHLPPSAFENLIDALAKL